MSLKDYRENIDLLDNEILILLKERFENIEEIIKLKQELNLPIENQNREEEIFDNIIKNHNSYNIYFMNIYSEILNQSKHFQQKKTNSTKTTWL